jgi:predicted RNase H-like HicB family nuclease
MLYLMNQKITFTVSYEDGCYSAVASGKDYAIVTEGKTFELLKKNIQEAVALYLESDETLSRKESSHVSLVASFKIPFPA